MKQPGFLGSAHAIQKSMNIFSQNGRMGESELGSGGLCLNQFIIFPQFVNATLTSIDPGPKWGPARNQIHRPARIPSPINDPLNLLLQSGALVIY